MEANFSHVAMNIVLINTCSEIRTSSTVLRISSRVGSSSGMDCSPWVDGWDVSQTLVGLGTLSRHVLWWGHGGPASRQGNL